jgi:hypothetical protein
MLFISLVEYNNVKVFIFFDSFNPLLANPFIDIVLHGLYPSPSIVRVIKARRMRWAGPVRGAYNILVWRPEGRRPL